MTKPYFENESVKLYHGNCLDILPQINIKFDCCITDPPYGTTACQWDSIIPFEPMWEQLNRLIKDNGAIAIFGSEPFSSMLRTSNIKQFKYDWIWYKNSSSGFMHAKNMPLKNFEIISMFCKSGMGHKSLLKDNRMCYYPQGIIPCGKIENGQQQSRKIFTARPSHKTEYIVEYTNYPKSIIEINSHDKETVNSKRLHPTQKPVTLLEYLIKTYTLENEIVLDFCAGSSSTLVAAMNTGRKAIGIKLDEKYCELSANRLLNNEMLI